MLKDPAVRRALSYGVDRQNIVDGALAGVGDPAYLSSMLDVSTQAALLETVAAVQEHRELGVLLITHDGMLADTWCGEIADIRELTERDRSTNRRPLSRQEGSRAIDMRTCACKHVPGWDSSTVSAPVPRSA